MSNSIENQEYLKTLTIQKPKRMASIELARIICMIMVVFNHTFNQFYYVEGIGGIFAQYFNFINISAVGVYFMITGFFLFDGEFAYKKKLKHLCTQILIPVAIVLFFTMWANAITSYVKHNEANLWQALLNAFVAPIKMIFSWSMGGDYGHLWFIFAYVELMILYPVYYLLCQENKTATIARRVLLLVFFIYTFAENITWLINAKFVLHTFTLIQFSAAYLLLGYEFKRAFTEQKIANKSILSIGGGVLLFCVGLLSSILCFFIQKRSSSTLPTQWFELGNIPCIVAAVGFMILFLNIHIKGSNFLYLLSKSTFYVYLIHIPIHILFQDIHLNSKLYSILNIGSYFIIGTFCLILSFTIAILFVLLQGYILKKRKMKRVSQQDKHSIT